MVSYIRKNEWEVMKMARECRICGRWSNLDEDEVCEECQGGEAEAMDENYWGNVVRTMEGG